MVASSAPKKLFLSDYENTLFQVVKTLEIPSRLFWCYEKAISFGFRNLAFSGRQNVRNRFKIVFELRQSDFFLIWKIHFLCAPKHKKSRYGCFVAMKKRFLSDSEKSLFFRAS